jgi:hypothetical protein
MQTPPTHAVQALLFMTARDCEMYVAASLQSLARQTHDAIHVLFVDDASTDDTGDIARALLADLFPGRHTFVRNASRHGKARNAWVHLRPRVADADFVAVLDADDQLIDAEILAQMAARYRAGRDVVWTNYLTDKGTVGTNGPLDPQRSPRQQGWRTSHFFSFRAALLANVPQHYFTDTRGEWFDAACDIALALPVLDQTRRYEYLPVQAYRYTTVNPYSHHNLDAGAQGYSSRNQTRCAQEVYAKPPLQSPAAAPAPAAAAPATARAEVAASRPAAPAPAQAASAVYVAVAPAPVASRASGGGAVVDGWHAIAAPALASDAPALVDAAAAAGPQALTPMQVWALRRAATGLGRAPRILHVGHDRSAPQLAALAASLGGRLTCLTGPASQAARTRARLAAAGLSGGVGLQPAALQNLSFGDCSGDFPEVRMLAEDDPFDLVVVDARQPGARAEDALVSLPAVAGIVSPRGFSFCLLAPDAGTQSRAVEAWEQACGDLLFCPDAVGESGLLVMGQA